MKRLGAFFEILFLVVMLLLCLMVFMAGRGKVPYIFGHRILQVITDSMSPTISSETCIIIKKTTQEEVEKGDIITFTSRDPRLKGFLNTHRVHDIEVNDETGELSYITIGDASSDPDPYPVKYEDIKGEYVCELPFGKFIYRGIRFLSDQVNYFIVVMLPLFLCFMSYLMQLFKALFGKNEELTDEERALLELEEAEVLRAKETKKMMRKLEKQDRKMRRKEKQKQKAEIES